MFYGQPYTAFQTNKNCSRMKDRSKYALHGLCGRPDRILRTYVHKSAYSTAIKGDNLPKGLLSHKNKTLSE